MDSKNEDMGGKNNRNNDKDSRKKDKGKKDEIAEEEMPRNKKYMENEKGKQIKVSDDGDDLPTSWDWRQYSGIISNVLNQGDYLICWAIAFIRATEALFNIGKRLEQQHSFSIQHLVNHVELGKHGLQNTQALEDCVEQHGLLEEGECSYKRVKQTCIHMTPKIETIDDVVVIDNVDDMELAMLVMRHPVVGVLPLWTDLDEHGNGIYYPKSLAHGNLRYHAVLIIGFGVDDTGSYYWIVQNSWGKGWGQEGFGWIHREKKRGTGSLFSRVFYGEKKGYPQKKKR